MVWDTSRTQDPVLAQTGMCSDTHKEPVYEVTVSYTFSWAKTHLKQLKGQRSRNESALDVFQPPLC